MKKHKNRRNYDCMKMKKGSLRLISFTILLATMFWMACSVQGRGVLEKDPPGGTVSGIDTGIDSEAECTVYRVMDAKNRDQNAKMRIIGYVFGAREPDIEHIAAGKLTHINYAFANVIDNELVLQESDRDMLKRLNELKSINPDLKILVSAGGWTWSGNFSDAALTETSRAQFARSAAEMVREYGLDGIDIDWEYPGQPGAGNIYRPEDKQNFTKLLRAVREELDRMSDDEGHEGTDRYKLTIATGANQTYLDNTEMHRAHEYLDFINIMTYDYYGIWSETTGHHANLFPSAADPSTTPGSSARSVELHIEAGIPSEKLVLGVPFYARGWTGVDPENNGLYQPFEDESPNASFSELQQDYVNRNGFVRHWDEEALAPYLWNEEERVFYSYEDETSLHYKADYILEQGLSGVMFWEYSHDPDYKLLGLLHRRLIKRMDK